MLDHLIFDTTDFETINDTHSVGAYVRSGRSGALVTHHSSPEAGTVTFGFVDGDVTVGTDTIAETAHGMVTGDVIQLTTSGVLPAGLALATNYYVIRIDNDSFKLAASAKNAEEGIAVDITAAAGGGTHTVTEQEQDRRALDVWMVNPIDVNITQADEITVFQGTSPWVVSATDLDIRDLVFATDKVDVSGSEVSLDATTLAALENITVTQGTSPWVIGDGGGSITIDAVDLDIRDLTHVSDSVRLGDGSAFITDGDGSSDNIANTFNALDMRSFNYVYDSAGDNWDRLRGTGGSLFVSDIADTAIASASNPLGAANTAEDVVASPLPARKYLFLKNNDNKVLYVGPTGVSVATGFPISPGSILEMRAGPSIDIEWVATTTGHDLRTLELS